MSQPSDFFPFLLCHFTFSNKLDLLIYHRFSEVLGSLERWPNACYTDNLSCGMSKPVGYEEYSRL